MKRKIYLLFTTVCLVMFGGVSSIQAQTYNCLGHSNSCDPSGPAIKGIEIFKDGESLWSKSDGCNGGTKGYNVMSLSPSFVLEAGSEYTLRFTFQSNYGNLHNFIGFIDLNGDGDYADANEHISAEWGVGTGVQTIQSYDRNGTYTEKFKVACGAINGVTRMRFRTNLDAGFGFDNTANASELLGSYGETEEYTIEIKSPTQITSSFSMQDTVYFGSTTQAKSTGNGVSHWWYFDGFPNVVRTTPMYSPLPTNALGSFEIKYVAQNCAGKDSTTKKLTVINPPLPVEADFVANETTVPLYEEIQFYDLSDYGPTNWKWDIYDSSQNPPVEFDLSDKTGGTNQNPTFDFYEPGLFTVCLTGYNIFGWGKKVCKKDYINITPFQEWDVSAVWGTPIESTSGRLYDKGGENLPYENNASKFTNFLAVVPCNAEKIELTFKQFKMADDNDLVFVFDGTDVNGIPLHPDGGFKSSEWNKKVPFTLTANSGAFFIYYETNSSGVDSGFVADWVSTKGDGKAPIASFEVSDLLYNGVDNKFKNTTQNIGGLTEYTWTIDGNIESFSKDLNYTFYTDGLYEVCLYVETCLGKDSSCKTVRVETPQTITNTDFTADNYRPKIGEVVSYSVTNDMANSFEWSVNPPDFVYTGGTNFTSKEPKMSFTKPGCYTISLTAWNDRNASGTSKTIVKGAFICVIDYCKPSVTNTTTDISVNNVVIRNATEVLLNNSSGVEENGYSDFTSTQSADLMMGGKYTLEVRRNTNSDPWNGKVWIDWNIDGDFDDAGEEVFTSSSSSSNLFIASIDVPNYKVAFEGKARMRIAVGYKGSVPTKCGTSFIGEYEDYTINIIKDNDIPAITLKGLSTIVLQKGENFIEPGYIAIDASQGDITSDVTAVSDLDVNVAGYYTVTYSVCDNSGNCASPVVRSIKVVLDLTAPTLTLANPVINVNVNDKRACLGSVNNISFDYSTIGATASDFVDGNLTGFIQYDNKVVDMNTVGTYEVLFWVQDIQGNRDSSIAIVNVRDNFAPIILENGPTDIPLGSTWIEQTGVCDKYDGNPVLSAVAGQSGFPKGNVRGTYVVTYSAIDGSGNSSTPVVRTYRVDDFEAPTLYLNTADTIYHDVNNTYYSATPTAIDNYFDANEISIVKTGTVNEYLLGTYMEIYTATDPLNNKAVKTRYVKVVDREAPELSGNNLNVPLGKEFWGQTDIVITDNYYNVDVLRPLIEVISSNVNINEVGSYTMTFQLTDPSGNKSKFFTRNVNVGANYAQTIGLEELDLDKNINVYPIPTYNGIVKISMESITGANVKAKVINTLGTVIMDLGVVENNQEIDLQNISHGIYFIRFEVGGKLALKKIILN